MSDPFGMLVGMTETYVTATDFRAHIAQITNCVAWRHDRVIVTRHGQEQGGFVCQEDIEFLKKHKPMRNTMPSGDVFSPRAIWEDGQEGGVQRAIDVPPPEPEPEQDWVELPDPWEASEEDVRFFYELVKDRWNESPEMMEWWGKASGRLG